MWRRMGVLKIDNFMKQLFRNFLTSLKRYKMSSVLNILGLAVAFASFYVIMVQVDYDLGYNKELPQAERIYRMELRIPIIDKERYNSFFYSGFMEGVVKGIPDVEALGGESVGYRERMPFKDKNGKEYILYTSTFSRELLDVLGVKPLMGSFDDGAKTRYILSESAAEKYDLEVGDYFVNPWVTNIESEFRTVTVAAIIKDFPKESDWEGLEHLTLLDRDNQVFGSDNWSSVFYCKIREGADLEGLLKLMHNNLGQWFVDNHWIPSIEDMGQGWTASVDIRLTSLEDTYFSSGSNGTGIAGKQGNEATTYSLLAVAILIIVIALINFVNFFFALVPVRIRSVNTQKIYGASLFSLRAGFVLEALGIVVLSLALAAVIVYVFAETSMVTNISKPLAIVSNLNIASLSVVVGVVVALAGSLYPSYYITSFPATFVLKGSFAASRSGRILRYALIGFQFVISISLIVVAIFIGLQNKFMKNYDMGFDKEGLMGVYISQAIVGEQSRSDAFIKSLMDSGMFGDAAFGNGPIVRMMHNGKGSTVDGEAINFDIYNVSWDFLKLMGVEVLEGRDFLASDHNKERSTMIMTKKTAELYNFTLESGFSGMGADVVGICENFNFKPLRSGIGPYCFVVDGLSELRDKPNYLYLRTLEDVNEADAVALIKKKMQEFDPNDKIELRQIQTFQAQIDELYSQDDKVAKLISLFAVISIIISLMGVFCLVLFETQFRSKEIALRRVHGASVSSILRMFNIYFVKIVCVSFLVAAPISFFVVKHYLAAFAYYVPLYWWVFVVALLLVFMITILVVTARSYSAASSNPAEVIGRNG